MIPRKAFLVCAEDRRAGDRRLRHRDSRRCARWRPGIAGGLCALIAGSENRQHGEPQPYLHSHMLAVSEAYRNRGLGTQLKLEQRTRGARTRHPPHGVDLRSAGDQERFSQYPQAGSDCLPVRSGFLWCILISTAGWAPDRPSGGRVAARFAQGRRQFWRAVRQPHRSSRSAFRFPPPSTSGRPRKLAGNGLSPFSWRTAASFKQAFSQGLAVLGYTLDAEGNGVFELGPLTQAEAGDESQGAQKTL